MDRGGVRWAMTQGQGQKRPEWKRSGHQRENKEGVGKGQMVEEKETGEKEKEGKGLEGGG